MPKSEFNQTLLEPMKGGGKKTNTPKKTTSKKTASKKSGTSTKKTK